MVGTGILPVGYLAAEFLEFGVTETFQRILVYGDFNASTGLHIKAKANQDGSTAYVFALGDNVPNTVNFNGLRLQSNAKSLWAAMSDVESNWRTFSISHPTQARYNEIFYNFKNDKKLGANGVYSADRLKNLFISKPVTRYGLGAQYRWNQGSFGEFYFIGKYFEITVSQETEIALQLIPAVDEKGVPCMFDKVTRKPFYNLGPGSFIVGMDMKQARKLGKLPSTGGELTVSLPWAAGVDAQVQVALAKAAETGWTVMVQYREPEVASENIEVDFLESTGTQWLRTDSVTNGGTVFSAKIALMKYISNAPSFFGAREGYPKKMFCVCLNEKKLVFRYDSKNFVASGTLEIGKAYEVEYTDEVFRVNDVETVVSRASFENPNPLGIFQTITGNGAGTDGILSARLFYLHLTTVDALGEVHAYNYVPALNANGKPCLYDKERGKNFYNAGSGSFIAGFESTEKAALGLAKLPVVEAGELTVSLPAAAQEEATRVPAAIEVARQRGWTIITQYRED